jgi:hypothetical protein
MAHHIVLVFMSDTPKGHKNIALGKQGKNSEKEKEGGVEGCR